MIVYCNMRIFKSTLIFLLFTLFGCNSYAQQVFVLAVGVSDYPGTRNDLRLPTNDATAIIDLYKNNSSATTKLLLNEDATYIAITNAAKSLYKSAGPEDIVVFYFSGHGQPSGFNAYDKPLDYGTLKEIFANCQAKHKMIFADACFSGKLRDAKDKSTSSTKDIDVMLFLSSRHNEASIERPQMVNGFFTACLLKCLKGGADIDRNRIITAKELYQEVSRGVKTLSNDQQHPVMWGNFDHDMTIMKW